MKKVCILGIVVWSLLLVSCGNGDLKGFKRTSGGLYYRFEQQNQNAQKVNEGDMLVGELTIRLDTTVISTNVGQSERIMLVEPMYDGILHEGLLMMHKGDRAIFAYEADSIAKNMPDNLPSTYKKGNGMKLYYEIYIQDIVTKSELEAERLERERIERERIERESQLNGKWIRTYFNEALWRQEQEIVTFSGKLLRLQFSTSGNESIYEYERVANKIYVNGTLFFTIEPNGNLNCKGDIYERIR